MKDFRILREKYIYLHFLVIQAQERAEQSGQHEKQNDGHKDRGGNFLEVTSRGNARFARPGPSPLRVLGNSFYIRSNVRPSSRAFLLQTLLLLFDLKRRLILEFLMFRFARNSPIWTSTSPTRTSPPWTASRRWCAWSLEGRSAISTKVLPLPAARSTLGRTASSFPALWQLCQRRKGKRRAF